MSVGIAIRSLIAELRRIPDPADRRRVLEEATTEYLAEAQADEVCEDERESARIASDWLRRQGADLVKLAGEGSTAEGTDWHPTVKA